MNINIINQIPLNTANSLNFSQGTASMDNEDFINNFSNMSIRKESLSVSNNSSSPSKKKDLAYNYYFGDQAGVNTAGLEGGNSAYERNFNLIPNLQKVQNFNNYQNLQTSNNNPQYPIRNNQNSQYFQNPIPNSNFNNGNGNGYNINHHNMRNLKNLQTPQFNNDQINNNLGSYNNNHIINNQNSYRPNKTKKFNIQNQNSQYPNHNYNRQHLNSNLNNERQIYDSFNNEGEYREEIQNIKNNMSNMMNMNQNLNPEQINQITPDYINNSNSFNKYNFNTQSNKFGNNFNKKKVNNMNNSQNGFKNNNSHTNPEVNPHNLNSVNRLNKGQPRSNLVGNINTNINREIGSSNFIPGRYFIIKSLDEDNIHKVILKYKIY